MLVISIFKTIGDRMKNLPRKQKLKENKILILRLKNKTIKNKV